MATNVPARTYTAREFATLSDAFVAFIKQTRPDLWTDFYQSNLGTVLLDLLAYVGDVAAYGQDAALNEVFLATCRRYESALSFARSVGYTPVQATAAQAEMFANVEANSDLLLYGGTISAGAVFRGENGLSYELLTDVIVPPSTARVRLPVSEGSSLTETFAATGLPNQTVQVSTGNVAADSWHVFVGDPDDAANEWRQVDAVSLETSATKTYEVSFNALGKLSVRFGDNTAGAVPSASITVRYRSCAGSSGNTPVQSIRGTARAVISTPGTGSQTLTFENFANEQDSAGATTPIADEVGQAVPALATITIQLANQPVQPGTVAVTIPFNGSGTLVMVDDGFGNFPPVNISGSSPFGAAPTGITSAYINYQTALITVAFTGAVAPINAGLIPTTSYSYFTNTDTTSIEVRGAAVGGKDRETLNQLRTSIPSYIRNQDRLISTEDYETALRRVAGVGRVRVDARPIQYLGSLVRLNVWGDETVSFTSTGDTAAGSAKYRRHAIASTAIAAAVQNYAAAKTLASTRHSIVRPGILWTDMYLRGVVYDQTYDAQTIRNAITAAVVKVFADGDGFSVRLSEVYTAIYAVPGVRYFTINRIALGTVAASSNVPEQIGDTLASASQSFTLLSVGTLAQGAVASPGTVKIAITTASGARIILDDNANGAFTLTATAGLAISLVSSSINYVTGAVSVTFSAPIPGNLPVTAYYDNVYRDYRQNQKLLVDNIDDGDFWPPVGYAQTTPVDTSLRQYDGLPIATVPATSTEYEGLKDIVVLAALSDLRFYDNTYFFDNSFYYDSEARFNEPIRAINLRRLNFAMVIA